MWLTAFNRLFSKPCPEFFFSTSLAPVSLSTAIKGLELLMQEPERVTCLQKNIRYFCHRLQENGIHAQVHTTIIIGDEGLSMRIMAKLRTEGYYIAAIRYPTVAKGTARLRITLMSTHTRENMDGLVAALVNCREKLHCTLG